MPQTAATPQGRLAGARGWRLLPRGQAEGASRLDGPSPRLGLMSSFLQFHRPGRAAFCDKSTVTNCIVKCTLTTF